MPMTVDDLRFAVLDARERHKGQVDLMHNNTRRALSILQLYVALAATALSGGAVGLLSSASPMPRPLGVGLATFGFAIAAGTVFSLIALWPIEIRLPGRDPDFWQWADGPDVPADHALRECLKTTAEGIAINRKATARIGLLILGAKAIGAAAPLLGAAAALAAWSRGF